MVLLDTRSEHLVDPVIAFPILVGIHLVGAEG